MQPLRRMPSRSVEYVESGDVTGPESAGQMHTCYLVWSFEETWIGSLACRSVGFQAVTAAYSSHFVCCKNMQRLGCAVPWNSAILRSLSARRMSGSGSNRKFKQKGRKGVFYFLLSGSSVKTKKMVIIRTLGSDGSQWVAMAGKSLYRPWWRWRSGSLTATFVLSPCKFLWSFYLHSLWCFSTTIQFQKQCICPTKEHCICIVAGFLNDTGIQSLLIQKILN